jgi:deoxyribodipyrimidine photo-lyase
VQESHAHAEAREAFLEQLLVRRTLAFAHALADPHHDRYATVPEWARKTLSAHARDPRSPCAFDDWTAARTGDPLWNAAQRELRRDGTIHPYARMLWGKVAITLATKPEQAFEWLVDLNDRYALDGRDPAAYANIAWCFGLHDRPFPQRAVFGSVRSMTSRSAATKWNLREYLARVGAPDDLTALERPGKRSRPAFDEFDQRTRDED